MLQVFMKLPLQKTSLTLANLPQWTSFWSVHSSLTQNTLAYSEASPATNKTSSIGLAPGRWWPAEICRPTLPRKWRRKRWRKSWRFSSTVCRNGTTPVFSGRCWPASAIPGRIPVRLEREEVIPVAPAASGWRTGPRWAPGKTCGLWPVL